MITKAVIEGLQILAKYRDVQDGHDVGAEHDVLYAYSTDKPVVGDDLARLIELGWIQEDADYDGGDDFTAAAYDPELSWAAYV